MTVNPSIPAEAVPQFIAYAKANKGKINMASGGIGSTPHVAGELFSMMASIWFMSPIAPISSPICSLVRCNRCLRRYRRSSDM